MKTLFLILILSGAACAQTNGADASASGDSPSVAGGGFAERRIDGAASATESDVRATRVIDRKYLSDGRGGCYYLSSTRRRKYVDKTFCQKKMSPNKIAPTPAHKVEPGSRETPPPETDAPASEPVENGSADGSPAEPANKRAARPNRDPFAIPETAGRSALPPASAPPKTESATSAADSRTYRKDRRGCYYLNEAGKKIYVPKNACGK